MPTVLRASGFAFRFYAKEHDPPHVHAIYGGTFAVIEIESARVRRVERMRDPDIARAQALVREHQHTLMAAWFSWKEKRRKGSNGLAGSH